MVFESAEFLVVVHFHECLCFVISARHCLIDMLCQCVAKLPLCLCGCLGCTEFHSQIKANTYISVICEAVSLRFLPHISSVKCGNISMSVRLLHCSMYHFNKTDL